MDMRDAVEQTVGFVVDLGLRAEVEDLGDAETFDAIKVGVTGLVEASTRGLTPTGGSAVDSRIATEIPEVHHAVHRKQSLPHR